MAWPVIGKAFTPAEFETYVQGLKWGSAFKPKFIVLHNTAAPSLADRLDGLTKKHILNLQSFYKSPKPKGRGWSGGPHLFIDDLQIWVFNDLTKRGVHSPSWNAVALGIEMLGDFDKESFTKGRGRKVRDNTVAAMAILNNRLGFAADAFKFHIEDTRSDHACPGKLARAERSALVEEIAAAMAEKPVAVSATTPPSSKPPSVAKTVTSSKSLLAIILTVIQLVVTSFTEWMHSAWDFILWALGVLPAITAEVKTTVVSSEEVSKWLQLEWKTISVAVALATLTVVFIRHLNDKRRLASNG